jgi:ribonuclease R
MPAAVAPDSFVGVLSRRGRFMVAEPLFERGRRVTVDVRGRVDVSVGDIALVQAHRGGRPAVVRALGRPDVARDVVEALLVEQKHARRFDARVEDDARAAARAPDRRPRRDLCSLPTFTIDPAEARDFDDAVSAEPDGDGLRVYVHIADVAAHVAVESPIDAEARSRGNSVYVPGTVESMLPEALSSDACSLIPGVPRKAVTAEIRIGSNGEVIGSSFFRSLIRSDVRFTYEQVERIFEGHENAPGEVAKPLSRARKLAAALRQERLGRGALGLETSEPEFEFDAGGHVVRAIDAVQTESHNLIEELMILANEEVARTLSQKRTPTLYRVHEQPEPAAIEFLAEQLESLDIPTPPIPDQMTPRVAGGLAGALGAAVEEHLRRGGGGGVALTSLVLRSLKQAYYSPTNVGHAGLASAAYTHFTSPIRRYPDLVVHRALLAASGDDEHPPPAHALTEIGWHCSQTEREAAQVEHRADDVCLAFLLEHDLFERGWERRFEGEVSGLVHSGAFVSFTLGDEHAAACEGFLPARRLRGEYFELNEERTALVGRRTGKRLRLGDPVDVSVESVEPPRGRIDLAPANREESPNERPGRKRGARSEPRKQR